MTVLSRDKTEVSRGVGGGGECRKIGRKCHERMVVLWNEGSISNGFPDIQWQM